MNSFEINSRLNYLRSLKCSIEESLAKAPDGRLNASMSKNNNPSYYFSEMDEKDGKYKKQYINKQNIEFAKKLAQKQYDEKMISVINQEIKIIERFLQKYNKKNLHEIFQTLPDARKALIKPYTLSDEEFVQKWEAETLGEQNPFQIDHPFITNKGEKVRSKSEKMIADELFRCEIPYKYEAALLLKKNYVIYPDFTVLSKKDRKVYYYEHFGMMGDEEYCRKAMIKLSEYRKYGIELGKDLVITMECSKRQLDMADVRTLIEKRFL